MSRIDGGGGGGGGGGGTIVAAGGVACASLFCVTVVFSSLLSSLGGFVEFWVLSPKASPTNRVNASSVGDGSVRCESPANQNEV